MLVLGLTGLAWISGRWMRLRHADDQQVAAARRDFAVSLALGAWPVIRVARRAPLATAASAALVVALFGLGLWSFHAMLNPQNAGPAPPPPLQHRAATLPRKITRRRIKRPRARRVRSSGKSRTTTVTRGQEPAPATCTDAGHSPCSLSLPSRDYRQWTSGDLGSEAAMRRRAGCRCRTRCPLDPPCSATGSPQARVSSPAQATGRQAS
jgi:hypothetical protein